MQQTEDAKGGGRGEQERTPHGLGAARRRSGAGSDCVRDERREVAGGQVTDSQAHACEGICRTVAPTLRKLGPPPEGSGRETKGSEVPLSRAALAAGSRIGRTGHRAKRRAWSVEAGG